MTYFGCQIMCPMTSKIFFSVEHFILRWPSKMFILIRCGVLHMHLWHHYEGTYDIKNSLGVSRRFNLPGRIAKCFSPLEANTWSLDIIGRQGRRHMGFTLEPTTNRQHEQLKYIRGFNENVSSIHNGDKSKRDKYEMWGNLHSYLRRLHTEFNSDMRTEKIK